MNNKVLSIQEYNETHNIFYIFGIKIKYPKPEYLKLKKQNPFYEYQKNNTPITEIPAATGQIRDIQLANLALLKELDFVCKKNHLQYWLDFGTLLGAIRHKGFIPWDDDIDVSMMRDDYNKIIEAFNTSSRNSDIYAEQTYLGKGQTIIKVKHKKCPHLFVDIFPHDYANCNLDKKERIQKTKKLHDIRQKMNKEKCLDNSPAILNKIENLNKEIIPDVYVEQSDIQCGLEYAYTEPLWIYKYDTVYPLKEISFEGFMAMCINKPQEYLSEIFGNYMSYPKKIGFGHSMYLKLSDEDKKIIEELIRNQ